MINSRFLIVILITLFIWCSLIYVMITKGHELSTHPCNLCAEMQGESVFCTIGGLDVPLHRTYFPNGSITNGTRTFVLSEP